MQLTGDRDGCRALAGSTLLAAKRDDGAHGELAYRPDVQPSSFLDVKTSRRPIPTLPGFPAGQDVERGDPAGVELVLSQHAAIAPAAELADATRASTSSSPGEDL